MKKAHNINADKNIWDLVIEIAKSQRRSLSNMVEMVLSEWLKERENDLRQDY